MELAHYFLGIAAQTNNIPFMQEFINCLCNMKDPSALSCISAYADQVNRYLSDNDPDESIIAFREFLERRYVYAQIDLRMYDEARQHLNQMIARGVSVDFAKKELAYLDDLAAATSNDIPNETDNNPS